MTEGMVIGVIAAVPLLVAAYLAFRSSRGKDKVAKEAGEESGQSIWIAQVLADNRDLRAAVKDCQDDAREIRERLTAIETGSADLREKNRELERENETLHTENRALKVEIDELKERIGELERVNGKSNEEGSL